MDISVLSSLAIVGVALSLLTQWLKHKFDSVHTQIIVVGLSVFLGVAYFFIKSHTNLIADILGILAAADTVYSYVFQYMEKQDPTPGATGS